MAGIWGNSTGGDMNEIKSFIERIENLETEKKAMAEDIRSIYKEAKDRGFDTKALRRAARLHSADQAKRREEEAVLGVHLSALGIL